MHVALARAAIDQLALDRVLFIPAGDPWRKAGRRVSPAADRLAMTRLTVAGAPACACSDMELRRPGPTYSADTVHALAAQGWAELWFIVGSDALADLPHWHNPPALIAVARLAVAVRPSDASTRDELDPTALDALVPGLAARVDWLRLDPDPLSATELRARIGSGGPVAGDAAAAVVAYARRRGLYGAAEE